MGWLTSALKIGGAVAGLVGAKKQRNREEDIRNRDYARELEMQSRAFAHADKWNEQQLAFSKSEAARDQGNFSNAVLTRVVDAKNAGVHPAIALGMNVGSGPVNFIPGQAATGGHSSMGVSAGDSLNIAESVSDIATDIEMKAVRKRELQEKRAAQLAAARAEVRDEALTSAQVRAAEARASRDQAEAAEALWRVQRGRVEYAQGNKRTTDGVNPKRDPLGETRDNPEISSIVLPNGKRVQQSASSTSERLEAEYGDIVQNVYGLWKLGNDAAFNFGGPENWRRYDPNKRMSKRAKTKQSQRRAKARRSSRAARQ